jgi:hypothetical protein
MIDETELPVLTNLTEALAPIHEPAPIPADTTVTLPSGEAVPLHIVREDATYPVAEPMASSDDATDDDEAEEGYFDNDFMFETIGATFENVQWLCEIVEKLEDALTVQGAAINQILIAMQAGEKRPETLREMVERVWGKDEKAKPKAKAKTKAKPKAKAKAKAKAKR